MRKTPQLTLALCALAIVVGATVYLKDQDPNQDATADPSTAATHTGNISTPMAPPRPSNSNEPAQPTTAASVSAAVDAPRPEDFSQEEWDQLLAAVQEHPNPQAELTRLITYLRYQRDLQRWHAAEPHTAERQALGQQLLESLPTRLANREVTASEALMLQGVIYTDLIPDQAERTATLEQARSQLQSLVDNDPVYQAQKQQDQARQQTYKARETEILARFKAGQIDAAQFEKELQAARVESYEPTP